MVTTRKKTKVVGERTYIDEETGELVKMNVVEVEERDCNFEKLWIGHVAQTLEVIGNQKMKILTHILRNRNNDNMFLATHRELIEALEVSAYTVNETLKALQEGDFLTKIRSGAYRINPKAIFKGSHNNRMNVLIRYKDEKAKNGTTPESQEEALDRKIEKMQQELDKLKTQKQLETEKQKPQLKLAK